MADENNDPGGLGGLGGGGGLGDEDAVVVEGEQHQPDGEGEVVVDAQLDLTLGRGEDDGGMKITDEERDWALAIKAAIESDPEIDPLSDFQYTQYALVHRGNVEAAVAKAQHMQWFRQEYDIRDTLEDAKGRLKHFLGLFDNFILSFSYMTVFGSYVCIFDLTALTELVTEKEWKTHFGGLFYLLQAMNPDIQSIRSGIVTIYECGGFELKKVGGVSHGRRVSQDFFGQYPTKRKKAMFFHTGMFLNLFLAMMKPFLPRESTQRFEVGCIFQGRLDSFCLTPDPSTAQQRNYTRILETLRRRYQNETNFTLSL